LGFASLVLDGDVQHHSVCAQEEAHLTHGYMYKHPFSAAIHMLPAASWIGAFAVCAWPAVRLSPLLLAPDTWHQTQKPWFALLFFCGFVAVAIYCVRMAYKEYKEALPALRADRPLLEPQQPNRKYVPTRYPLAETQKIQLQTAFATLLATGVLRADEVTFEELVDCAEMLDDYSRWDCSEAIVVFNVLSALHSDGRQFHNLAFVADQVEVEDNDILTIVREFARLAGQTDQLRSLRLKGIGGGEIVLARRGELPPDNAVVEFQLASHHCAVPFVMYGKNSPLGLMETLPEMLIPAGESRRFFSAYFDAFLAVTYLSADQIATLNLAFSHQPDCFELLK
jgi:hypothetical protein